jgi:hypothetical protein
VVKGTALANDWRRGAYRALAFEDYVATAATLIEHTPPEVVFHRLTGTASAEILLAPAWCAQKWRVLNAIAAELVARGSCQGAAVGRRLDQIAETGRRLATAKAEPSAANPASDGGQPAAPARTRREYIFVGSYAASLPHTVLAGAAGRPLAAWAAWQEKPD